MDSELPAYLCGWLPVTMAEDLNARHLGCYSVVILTGPSSWVSKPTRIPVWVTYRTRPPLSQTTLLPLPMSWTSYQQKTHLSQCIWPRAPYWARITCLYMAQIVLYLLSTCQASPISAGPPPGLPERWASVQQGTIGRDSNRHVRWETVQRSSGGVSSG